MTLSERLDEILKRCEAATPGPWYVWDETWVMTSIPGDEIGTNKPAAHCEFDLGGPQNAESIAHARTDLPLVALALKKAVERLTWIDNEASKGDCWKNGDDGTSVLTLKEVAHQTLAEIEALWGGEK